MAKQTSECGMIPEQVWDAADIPERMLVNGRPSGSGMPLVWAHSEYIKLLRSIHEGEVWDLPPQTVQRYQVEKRSASFQIWTPTQKRGWLSRNKSLRIDLPVAARIRWTASDDAGVLYTKDTGFGLHVATLPCAAIGNAERIEIGIEPEEAGGEKLSFVVRVREPHGAK